MTPWWNSQTATKKKTKLVLFFLGMFVRGFFFTFEVNETKMNKNIKKSRGKTSASKLSID